MEVVNVLTAAEFLERSAPLLLADEARHNLILGLAGTLRDHPDHYPDFGLWLVEDGERPVGAALRTRPHGLVLARGSDEAVALLAGAVDDDLPGVVGAIPEVDMFAAAYGKPATPRVRQGIYSLRRVVPPAPISGHARAATLRDRDLLLGWWRDFSVEALPEEVPDEERLARSLDYRFTSPAAGIALWEDAGRIVSMAGFGSPTPTGVRIGPVYTPPEHRRRGYASALTAHVSAEQLAAGRGFCFLYTDLANPTSNKIYIEIGYRRLCDAAQYAFGQA